MEKRMATQQEMALLRLLRLAKQGYKDINKKVTSEVITKKVA